MDKDYTPIEPITYDNIPLTGVLVPGTTAGVVTESKYIKGGYIVVQTIDEMNALLDKSIYEDSELFVNGSPVYVVEVNKVYRRDVNVGEWVEDTANLEDIIQEIANIQNDISGVNSVLDTKADKSEIPTNISQLKNDVNFVDANTDALQNYYNKTDIDAKDEENLIWEDATPVDVDMGLIHKGDILKGQSLKEILQQMFYTAEVPVFTEPSFEVEYSPAVGVAGATITVEGVAKFDRGTITPNYGTSGFRAGEPTTYVIGGQSFESSELSFPFTASLADLKIGENTLDIQVNFAEGEQPLDSRGHNYDAPYQAGSLVKQIVVNGLVASFSGSSETGDTQDDFSGIPITDASVESKDLSGMFEDIGDNGEVIGSGYQVSIPESTGPADVQYVLLPEVVEIKGIKSFDSLAGEWSWYHGESAEESLASNVFVKSGTVQKQIGDQNVNYTKYSYNSDTYGAIGRTSFRFYI